MSDTKFKVGDVVLLPFTVSSVNEDFGDLTLVDDGAVVHVKPDTVIPADALDAAKRRAESAENAALILQKNLHAPVNCVSREAHEALRVAAAGAIDKVQHAIDLLDNDRPGAAINSCCGAKKILRAALSIGAP